MDDEIIDIVDKYYKKKIDQSSQNFQIGIELEFPIIKFGGNIIDMEVIRKLAFFIVEDLGFSQIIFYSDGIPVKMKNPSNKDIISFEYCFSNLEFSLASALRIDEIAKRFWDYYEKIMNFLIKREHLLISQGTNPYKWVKHVPILQTDYHKVINIFHKRCKRKSVYKMDHWASMIASSQTHIHLREENFVDVLNVLNKTEWIKGLLFANSSFWNGKIDPFLNMSSRDYFWQNNGFVSKEFDHPVVDLFFCDMQEYYQFLLKKMQVFYVMRDNKYISLKNMNLRDYYKLDVVQGKIIDKGNDLKNITIKPEENDLEFFRSYFYNILTGHGTLEMRSDGLQPLNDLFVTVAFNIGIVSNYNKIKKIIDFITIKNSDLRIKATKYQLITDDWKFLNMSMKEFLYIFYDLVKQGLVERGYGEEKYIECLCERIDKLENPGIKLINLLKTGMNLNDVINLNNQRDYL